MLESGCTLAVAKLLLAAAKHPENGPIIDESRGARALREVSAYAEDFAVRKEATDAMHKMLGLPELRNLNRR